MISPEEGLKSVLIVNLSRIGLSPGSVPPPPPDWSIRISPSTPPSPVLARNSEGPARAYLLPQLTIASQSSGVSLLAPRSWNLITASLANLELIHFRWRWLITADGKSHPGRASTLLAVNEKRLELDCLQPFQRTADLWEMTAVRAEMHSENHSLTCWGNLFFLPSWRVWLEDRCCRQVSMQGYC